jgi:hypothetical protein
VTPLRTRVDICLTPLRTSVTLAICVLTWITCEDMGIRYIFNSYILIIHVNTYTT